MKLKVKVLSRKQGGGGKSDTEEVNSIPEEFRPYLRDVAQRATGAMDEGKLSRVAGTTENQKAAFGMGSSIKDTTESGLSALESQKERLADLAATGGRDALMESASFEAAKQGSQIGRQYGAAGTLGSARQGIERGAMQAELANKVNQTVFSNKLGAESALGTSTAAASGLASSGAASLAKLGDEERSIAQQEADKDYQGLQRFASIVYANPARSTVTQEGKGK